MKNLIFVFACLFSVSVFGQGQIKLHQASRDSLIGNIDESGEVEIWKPANVAFFSPLSYQDAFFDAIKSLAFSTSTRLIIETDDSITKNTSYGEVFLNGTEDLVVKCISIHNEKSGDRTYALKGELTIHHNKNIIASQEFGFIEGDFKNNFKLEMFNPEENIDISPSVKHKQSVYDVFENHGSFNRIQFYSDCDFSCVLELLHQSGIDFDFVYRGGTYYVWLSQYEDTMNRLFEYSKN